MREWPKHPVIYEINTWAWLHELSLKYDRAITLSTVPAEEWDNVSSVGADAVWFMGVWERSPAGIGIAMQNQGLLEDFRRALPDFSPADIVGSPYCVRRYVVDDHLGGPKGLAAARSLLLERGLRLILDFVPNHVAPDHPWVSEHPGYFIRGDSDDIRRDPASFFGAGGKVFACGRGPYFPAWPDVLQLNAFARGLRQAIIDTVSDIADQCEAIRCDMAMLVMNTIFGRTWGTRPGGKPAEDYWTTIIRAIKAKHPEFRFIAEAYWDLEWELQQQGFDFCYDKKLYDRMEHDNAEGIRQHVLADLSYQEKMVRFIENHDEPRAASVFSPQKERAAAVTIATIAGARLFHEGQFEGRKVRVPVFLGRRPVEPLDPDLQAFYFRVLKEIDKDIFRNGEWQLCERMGWPDNQSCLNILAWCWVRGDERYLVVINFDEGHSQALVPVPWDELKGRSWRLVDVLSDETFDRSGDEMSGPGLYVDLGPWKYHFLRLDPL
jgi:hypothetical protein